jgi:hypothetical protein
MNYYTATIHGGYGYGSYEVIVSAQGRDNAVCALESLCDRICSMPVLIEKLPDNFYRWEKRNTDNGCSVYFRG